RSWRALFASRGRSATCPRMATSCAIRAVCVASRPGVRSMGPSAATLRGETTMIRERRQVIKAFGLGAAVLTVPGAFAETLRRTATTGDGPFYPDRLPLDTDNDLLIINDQLTPA